MASKVGDMVQDVVTWEALQVASCPGGSLWFKSTSMDSQVFFASRGCLFESRMIWKIILKASPKFTLEYWNSLW